MDNCTLDCIDIIGNFSRQATCDFVQQNCVQDTVQFIQTYYCIFNQSFILLILFGFITLIIIYYGLNALTQHFLAPCVEQFIVNLNMSQALAGTTLFAFANGAPDIITAVVAGSSSSDSTALIPFGSLYGGALFDMAFLLGMVIQLSPSEILKLKKKQTLIPLGFYLMGTTYLICVSLFYGKMNILIASIFLSFYLIYLGIVIYNQRKKKQSHSIITNSQEDFSQSEIPLQEKMDQVLEEVEKDQAQMEINYKNNPFKFIVHYVRMSWKFVLTYTIPPNVQQEWTPVKAIISLILAPFVSAISYVVDSFTTQVFGMPYVVWFHIPSVPLLIHSLFCIYRKVKPKNTLLYSLYSFVIIVCWVATVCSVLINIVELFQLLTHINSVFLGLTILAWANCIADYLSVTTFAKKGYASTAISGIFSGQLFNFLLGFGLSNIMKSLDGQTKFVIFDLQGNTFDKISDFIVIGVIGLAFTYMVTLFITIIRTNGVFQATQKKYTKIYYLAFVLTALMLSIMTDFFREESCQL